MPNQNWFPHSAPSHMAPLFLWLRPQNTTHSGSLPFFPSSLIPDPPTSTLSSTFQVGPGFDHVTISMVPNLVQDDASSHPEMVTIWQAFLLLLLPTLSPVLGCCLLKAMLKHKADHFSSLLKTHDGFHCNSNKSQGLRTPIGLNLPFGSYLWSFPPVLGVAGGLYLLNRTNPIEPHDLCSCLQHFPPPH